MEGAIRTTRRWLSELITRGASEGLTRAVVLFGSRTTGLGIASLSIILTARFLDSSNFGQFVLLRSLTSYFGIFFDFGTSIATGRLLAISDDYKDRQNLTGAWVLIFLPIALGYSFLLVVSSLWVDEILHVEIGEIMFFSAVPALGIPLERSLREILKGHGSAFFLAILNVAPWVFFLLMSGILAVSGVATLETVTLLYFGSFFVTMVTLVVLLRPRFDTMGKCLRQLKRETRTFGLNAYIGRVVGTGTFQLDSPMIAYFTEDPAAVGFYGLAKTLVGPISLGSASLGVSVYRGMVRATRLAKGLVRVNFLWLLFSCSLYYLTAHYLVTWFFSPEYEAVLPLLYVWVVAAFIQGSYQLPNLFLSAKGKGRVLRDIAIWFGVGNIVLNLALIPQFGSLGASTASAAANALWLYMCTRSYHQCVVDTEVIP